MSPLRPSPRLPSYSFSSTLCKIQPHFFYFHQDVSPLDAVTRGGPPHLVIPLLIDHMIDRMTCNVIQCVRARLLEQDSAARHRRVCSVKRFVTITRTVRTIATKPIAVRISLVLSRPTQSMFSQSVSVFCVCHVHCSLCLI